jgi:two-component system NtrC family sensor kinase
MSQHSEAPTERAALVVDDEAMIRTVLQMVVSELGYEVDEAADGDEALQCLARRSYDVVLCDLLMPGMQGDELFRICRQENPQAASRFVFLSGCSGSEGSADFAANSGQPCLIKHRIDEVQAAIDQIARPVAVA